jgi:hypothetical protein
MRLQASSPRAAERPLLTHRVWQMRANKGSRFLGVRYRLWLHYALALHRSFSYETGRTLKEPGSPLTRKLKLPSAPPVIVTI